MIMGLPKSKEWEFRSSKKKKQKHKSIQFTEIDKIMDVKCLEWKYRGFLILQNQNVEKTIVFRAGMVQSRNI